MADIPPATSTTALLNSHRHLAPPQQTHSSTSTALPYGLQPPHAYTRMVPSSPHATATPSNSPLNFHLPSRPPAHGMTIREWVGGKKHIPSLAIPYPRSPRHHNCGPYADQDTVIEQGKDDILSDPPEAEKAWRDVHDNIKSMDQLYDATFYSWLKSEDNVLVTAMYLHRIANEYPLVRIINALKWLISDWRLESISTLVRHVTVDWCDEVGDLRRAHLLRHLTHSWATQYTTTLITMVLSTPPYVGSTGTQRERFLRAFTQDWDFSKLSEFFMYLQSPANIDYKVKCVMLQEAALRERETLGAKLSRNRRAVQLAPTDIADVTMTESQHGTDTGTHAGATGAMDRTASSRTIMSNNTISSSPMVIIAQGSDEPHSSPTSNASARRHHRRTSSNDVNDIKRLRLSTSDLDQDDQTTDDTVPPPMSPSSASVGCIASSPGPSAVSSIATTSSGRRSVTPDHHHHHHHHHHHLHHLTHSHPHHLRCVTSAAGSPTLTIRGSTSSGNGNGVPTANSNTSSTASSSTVSATVSSDLSHLHLGNGSTVTASTPSSAAVASVFTSACHSTCYPYTTSSAHLQVHGRRLRRRSSSSSSTSSNGSMSSASSNMEAQPQYGSQQVPPQDAQDAMDADTPNSSGIKKLGTPVNTGNMAHFDE